MQTDSTRRQAPWHALAAALFLTLAACQAGPSSTNSEDDMSLVSRGVTITSYNYTDRALNDITVDGAWSGGADAFSMSGSAAGLMAPEDRTKQHSVTVRWDVGSQYDLATNSYPEAAPPMEPHEATVPIEFPYPEHIEYLTLHFYPDGHVEAEFSDGTPERRIPQPEGFRR